MRILPICLVSALIVGVLATPAMADEGSVLLDVGVRAVSEEPAVLAALGDLAQSSTPLAGLAAMTVTVAADDVATAIADLKTQTTYVRYAEIDLPVHADGTASAATGVDPTAAGLDAANADLLRVDQVPGAWTWTTGTSSTVIAVVDSGVTPTTTVGASRLVAGDDVVGDDDTTDDDSHGTLVAGIAAEVCPQCRIMPVRALRHVDGGPAVGTAADVAEGIAWAADHGAHLINVSASTDGVSGVLADAVTKAGNDDSIVLASAGYDTNQSFAYPAADNNAVAVGSVGRDALPDSGTRQNTAYSLDSTDWIDVAAVDKLAALGSDGEPKVLTGPSASAAVASGIAGLIYAFTPAGAANIRQVRNYLLYGANQVPTAASYEAPVADAARGVWQEGDPAPVVADTGLPKVVGTTPVTITPTITVNHVLAYETIDGVEQWPWSQPMQLAAKPGDSYLRDISVCGYDYAEQSSCASSSVYFDAAGPQGSFSGSTPAPGAHVRGAATVDFYSADGAALTSVKLNGVEISHPTIYSIDDWSGTVPSGTSTYRIDFTDITGATGSISQTVVPDNAGPTATSLSPASGAHVRGTFTAGISGVADPSGVASAQLLVNGVSVGTDKTAPYALAVKTGTRNGNEALTWRLTDKLGNIRTYTRTVVADNTAPTLKITKAPANKAKVHGTVKVYASASDFSGVAKVQLLINGKVVATDTTAGYVLSINTSKLAKTMKVQVRAYDKLGNVRYTTTRTWYRR